VGKVTHLVIPSELRDNDNNNDGIDGEIFAINDDSPTNNDQQPQQQSSYYSKTTWASQGVDYTTSLIRDFGAEDPM
jgi:hypothetical protein